MMDDVIYRKDAANILCDWCDICPKEERDIMHCDDICPEFARIPSAQKKGYWRNYEGTLTCSVCETEFDNGIMEYCGDDVPMFCPYCGADMRGEADGENS